MSEELLTSVRLVSDSNPRVSALPHVGQLINAFRFSIDRWTLESASKRGFLSKLDHMRQNESRQGREFSNARFYVIVQGAVKNGYAIQVLQWWLDAFITKQNAKKQTIGRPSRKMELVLGAVTLDAIRLKRLDVLKWVYRVNQSELPQDLKTMVYSSDPEVTYWLHQHGRNLNVKLPMYECSAADPSFKFAKWCLAQQDAFICANPEDAVSFAIDHSQNEFLQWLFQQRRELFQPNHLDRAISRGRLEIAQWVLGEFPRQYFSDPSQALDISVCELGNRHVLKLIQWVEHELEWQAQKAKIAWMEGAMIAVAGAGTIDLLQAVKAEFLKLETACDSRLTSALMESASSTGQLKMVQWIHDHDYDRQSLYTIQRWMRDLYYGPKYIDKAAANGHLDVVVWLHANRYNGCTTDAIDHAAENGHLELVEWLHANRTEGCTTKAMHLAAENGHLKIVQWLHENRTEGCERNTLACAAGNGHLRVVQFLHSHRPECCQDGSLTRARSCASVNSDWGMYEWIDEHISEEERMRYRKCRNV